MTEAIRLLEADRKVAADYRAEQAAKEAVCKQNMETCAAEVARMDARIKEIDAAIKKLGGE